jgi:hypothetical protein
VAACLKISTLHSECFSPYLVNALELPESWSIKEINIKFSSSNQHDETAVANRPAPSSLKYRNPIGVSLLSVGA